MGRRPRTADEMTACLARLIRAAGRHVGQEDPAQLAKLVELQSVLAEAIQTAIDGQRDSGITWQSMAAELGVTKQAVIMRWGKQAAP